MQQSIWDKAGMFLAGLIARWTFGLLGGVLAGFNITAEQWELWVGAALSFIISALITNSQNKYLLHKEPPVEEGK